MTYFTKKATTLLLLVAAFAFAAQAQTAFYSEDFSAEGIPSGWMSEDETLQGGEWTWCDDPNQGVGDGCVVNWANYSDQHEDGFYAETADNGFLVMDSDALGGLPIDHVVNLTTEAIDCSGQTEVWAKFEGLIGVFGLPAIENAVLEVSNNGTDWTSYTVFPNVDIATRWSENPEISIIDISADAAGEATVYVRWSWTGNYEYYWLLDDFQLYDADPSIIFIPPNDMRVNSNFFATAPNTQWPLSQTEQFGFLADIENVGALDQSGVSLNVTITDPNADVVYTEDLDYGDIEVDSLAENVLFDGDGFTPDMMGTYNGTYTVSQTETDDNPDNNVQTFNFTMTDTLWAKHTNYVDATRPADANWEDPAEGWSWAYGNEYYCVDGGDLYIRTITFAVEESDGGSGNAVFLKVYTWEDDNADGLVNPDERGDAIGLATYTTTGSEDRTTPITLPITSILGEPIKLEDDTRYLAVIEYITDVPGDELLFGVSSENDYSAQIFRSEELGMARYASVLGINGDLEVEDYSTVGFGGDLVPAVAISIGTIESATENILSEENVINLFPNPAQDFLTIDLDLVENHDRVNLYVMDVTGKLVQSLELENIRSQQIEMNLNNITSGTYFLQVVTENGVRTESFMVQK
ncbi:MAG: T9SS type A sorting domain-containing protein [Bacteroidetes bacterium]|nr:T9SS type A sorting domain-containing protein [Bacteroidota bacterium]